MRRRRRPRPRPAPGDAAAGGRARARRRDRRWRAHRLLLRLLAGSSGLGRRGRREEGVPPREDLRGRPHATGRPAAGRHGPRGGPGRFPSLRGPTRLRLRPLHRHALAGAPELPRLRLHHHAPRPRRAGGRARGGRGGHPAPGHRGHGASRRRGRPAPRAHCRRSPVSRSRRRARRAPAPSVAATSWWPTDPIRGWAACSARHGAGTCPWAWHCAATTGPIATTTRSSSRTSTSATLRATWSPGTGGSSPWATAG